MKLPPQLAAASRGASLSPTVAARVLSAATAHASSSSSSSSSLLSRPLPQPRRISPLARSAALVSPRAYSSLDAAVAKAAGTQSSGLITVSTLPNRVRVATEATPGHFSAVGVYIDAGSRYERPDVRGESGVSHLLDRMAFKVSLTRGQRIGRGQTEDCFRHVSRAWSCMLQPLVAQPRRDLGRGTSDARLCETHRLTHLSAQSTKNRSAEELTAEIEALGGNVMCSSSRETIMYQSSVFNQDVGAVMSVLADTILHPALLEEELDAQRDATAWEIQEINNKPDMYLPELLHTVAFQHNTLGNALLCPLDSLEEMTAENLRDFMHSWYTPERIVVAGAGMPHEQLVQLAEKYFGGLQARPALEASSVAAALEGRASTTGSSSSRSSSQSSLFSRPSTASSSASTAPPAADFSTAAKAAAQHASVTPLAARPELAAQRARYTGGERYESHPDLEFTHVYVAFEGLSIHDDDIYALATLQMLLGGGGSFSAGGPGKGMYSRLYTNVLNQYHAVDYCAAFHHCYADSGLFGIAASVSPSFNGSIGNLIATQLELCTSPHLRGAITTAELARARNQLKSSLVMALESRLVEVEDLGRQVQVHGHKISVEEMCARIDEVDLARLHRVANRVLRPSKQVAGAHAKPLNFGLGSGQATVVAQGNLEGLGDVRQALFKRGLGAAPTSLA
jgi:processing peptidase subunit alpha